MSDYIISIRDESNLMGGASQPKTIASLEGYVNDDLLKPIIDAIRTAVPSRYVQIDVSRVISECEHVHKSGGYGVRSGEPGSIFNGRDCGVKWPPEAGWADE